MRFAICAIVLCAGACAAQAGIKASAELTPQSLGGGNFRYSGNLHNSGDTEIGTFWVAWVPGQNFMPHIPANIQSPAGWTASVSNEGLGDGYGIQFTADLDSVVPAGGSLAGFRFDTLDSPAVMSGFSPNHPAFRTTTSFVYIGPALFDPGFQFIATVVPAPSVIGALILPIAGLARRRR